MFTFSISKELVITNQRLKTYVVCVVQGLRADKVIITKFWKVARIMNALLGNSRN